jgi:predicted MFS family arabinose efflux permease
MWGWQMTFIITGCLVLIILVPANALFLRHKPQNLGQHPDGSIPADSNHKNHSQDLRGNTQGNDWTLRKAFSTLRFWALIFFPFFGFIAVFIIVVHQVKFLVDQGVDKMTAAFIFAMVGIVSSIFRVFWGWLSDRIILLTVFLFFSGWDGGLPPRCSWSWLPIYSGEEFLVLSMVLWKPASESPVLLVPGLRDLYLTKPKAINRLLSL